MDTNDNTEWTAFTIPRVFIVVKWLICAAGNALAAYSAVSTIGWVAIPLVIVLIAMAIGCLHFGWVGWTEKHPNLGPTAERLP